MSEDIGIDLGTSSVIVNVKGKGIVLREPSVIAIDKTTNDILSIGKEAKRMIGRTPADIEIIKPLNDGVISNFTVTSKMLKHFIRKACPNKLFSPRIMICVPSQITEVERRAVIDATMQGIGAKKVFLIEEPVAAAIGAGIDISKPCGNFVIDIGGGTTDVAVISIGGAVASSSINIAGNKFDEDIIKYVKKRYNLAIGEQTAENIKMKIGCVYPREENENEENDNNEEEFTIEARGRNLSNNLPAEIELTSQEIMKVLLPDALKIVECVKNTIEKAPPELVEDISERGIYMTGGGSLLYGMDRLIEESTGIKTIIAQDAVSCVAIGTGKALDNLNNINKKAV